ncbi:hypothetical protein BKA70DRAFT_1571587 [Coprinopsis sp. MPI-PUGE-AT-0042]|nr:hypothetical protein BKA70DRAFT_1571587 [Coprinopsis sp. MPI-PUGE-AT-0042]
MSSAPYGTCKSPISAEAITNNANSYTDILVDAVTGLCTASSVAPLKQGKPFSCPGRGAFSVPAMRQTNGKEVVVHPREMTRNITVIAHVDHGKTILVDQPLRQSGTLGSPSSASSASTSPTSSTEGEEHVTRLMDSNDLEKEREITILS